METKTLFGELETKFATTTETEAGTMTGYGAVFGNIDSYGDIVAAGAFTKTIADHKAAGTMPLMLLGHNLAGLPIGAWDSMEEDSYGLKLSGHFLPSGVGQDARITAAAGEIKGLSIGFVVTEFEMKNGHRIITGARVVEVSLVTMAANELACVSDIKSQENNMSEAESLNKIIAEYGSKLNELTELFKAFNKSTEAKMLAEQGDDCDDDEDCEDDCECGEDNTCECQKSDDAQDDQEAKYNEAAITAIVEVRREVKTLFQ